MWLSRAHGDDDFQPVGLRQRRLAMQALRHDLAIALDRDALAGIAERFEQAATVKQGGEIAAFAADDEKLVRSETSPRRLLFKPWQLH